LKKSLKLQHQKLSHYNLSHFFYHTLSPKTSHISSVLRILSTGNNQRQALSLQGEKINSSRELCHFQRFPVGKLFANLSHYPLVKGAKCNACRFDRCVKLGMTLYTMKLPPSVDRTSGDARIERRRAEIAAAQDSDGNDLTDLRVCNSGLLVGVNFETFIVF
jgi:hypothetical protein